MIEIKQKKDCCGCHACLSTCAHQAITMRRDSEGFLYPMVDEDLCTNCGLCEQVCPVIHQASSRQPMKVYAAKSNNEELRRQSSSGGVFTLLAEAVIHDGGVVFGARFDEQWNVVHSWTGTLDGLAAFRGSKYVQSRIEDNFQKIEVFLKQDTGNLCLHDYTTVEQYPYSFPKIVAKDTVLVETELAHLHYRGGIYIDIFLLQETNATERIMIRANKIASVFFIFNLLNFKISYGQKPQKRFLFFSKLYCIYYNISI